MSEQGQFSHITADGEAKMVDVGGKTPTRRTARAEATVCLGETVAQAISEKDGVAKGNVLDTARIAGIMAAKRTAELIPMCHPLPIDHIALAFDLQENNLVITSEVRCHGQTGVEMEALTAVSLAALTVYDMCKSASKGITIGPVRLLEKTGGKSGHWRRGNQQANAERTIE